ncbi:hypothetical protein EYF80_065232 [Liparis tanakae]|uniref:Uncharacterized protein n=1 Tax=Liparis tanakae TaxID=230148 RepID=A0A4Z2E8L0_9TELE|nr:hypothetical protein EYF80_065232 [Liparis tanakae]
MTDEGSRAALEVKKKRSPSTSRSSSSWSDDQSLRDTCSAVGLTTGSQTHSQKTSSSCLATAREHLTGTKTAGKPTPGA